MAAYTVGNVIARQQPVVEDCRFGPWKIQTRKSHILSSEGPERESFESQLGIPHVPEMIFAQNCLAITHERGFGIQFSTLEALKRVSSQHDLIQVAGAKEWKEARAECEHVDNIVHPFDWTFTTDYGGTLFGTGDNQFQVEASEEKIDIERLKVRETINFYSDLVLFEDELHDSGCSMLGVKIRIMPSYFFVLQRFYLRVDDVLIRVYDTRLFYATGADYILREHVARESKVSELKVSATVLNDPNEIVEHLSVRSQRMEKLRFTV